MEKLYIVAKKKMTIWASADVYLLEGERVEVQVEDNSNKVVMKFHNLGMQMDIGFIANGELIIRDIMKENFKVYKKQKVVYMIVFRSDTIADYTVYEDKIEAETVMNEKYAKYDCCVLHIPFKEVVKS